MSERLITAHGLIVRDEQAMILQRTTLDIRPGLTVITGPSGSGKSTLVNVLYGLLPPDRGKVTHYSADGEVVYRSGAKEQKSRLARGAQWLGLETSSQARTAAYRSKYLGYIAQQPYIPPEMTAADYIGTVHRARGNALNPDLLGEITEKLGISEHLGKTAVQLSGGEQQRVAIAFALAHEPRIVVADEPTSALDSQSGKRAMELMRSLVDTRDMSVICVSHDAEALNYADHIFQMQDGRVQASGTDASASAVEPTFMPLSAGYL